MTPKITVVTCGHIDRPHHARGQCRLCYCRDNRKSLGERLAVNAAKLSACEQAFVTYLVSVCEDTRLRTGDNHTLSPETILDTWWEAADDWMEAVKWGQAHPDIKELRSNRKPNIRLVPKFLITLEDTWGKEQEDGV